MAVPVCQAPGGAAGNTALPKGSFVLVLLLGSHRTVPSLLGSIPVPTPQRTPSSALKPTRSLMSHENITQRSQGLAGVKANLVINDVPHLPV